MPRRRGGRPIHGWLIIDKDANMTSSRVVAEVLRVTGAAKAGHGGTLDPMATGVLPVALGEATKTAAYIVGSSKTYRFTVRWGEARDTEDADGNIVATSESRPDETTIRSVLPEFVGTIEQVPPTYAAIKVNGVRAYALARKGEPAVMTPRQVVIERVVLTGIADRDHAMFEMRCGKGTYVRAFARDLAVRLDTVGHLAALRRVAVGQFGEDNAISLARLGTVVHSGELSEHVRPVETALADIPALAITEDQAIRLRHGQVVQVPCGGPKLARLSVGERLVAIAEVSDGKARPVRVFNV